MGKEFEWKLISKYRPVIMGIAIIWVMLLHVTELYPGMHIPLLTALGSRGNIGVDIFLLVSGMGVYFSLEGNPDVKSFYCKRVKRVLVPYLLISLPYFVGAALVEKQSFGDFILDYTGLSFWLRQRAVAWYIPFLISLYLIYPLIHKLKPLFKGLLCAIIILATVLSFMLLSVADLEVFRLGITRIPVFIIGSIIGQLAFENKKCKVYWLGAFLFLATGLGIGASLYLKGTEEAIVAYRYSSIFISLLLCLIVSILGEYRSFRCYGMLGYLGGITLELYLVHVFLRRLVIFWGGRELDRLIMRLLVQTAIIGLSLLICILLNYLREKVRGKRA